MDGGVELWLALAFASDGLLAGCSGVVAAVVLLGEGMAVEGVVSTVVWVFAMGAAGTGVGLGMGSATGGLDCLGNGPGLLELATRFDGLFVDLATAGSCAGDALAGARLDASSTGGLTDATLGAAFSTTAPVLATVAGDAGVDSVTFEAAGATDGAVPEGVNNSAAPITIATIAPKTIGKCFTESSCS